MGGAVALAVPVLDTAVGVRIPTTGLAGAVQIMAAVNDGTLGWSDTVVTTRVTDWPANQYYYLSSQSETAALPLPTVSVFLEVAAVWKINDEAELCVCLRYFTVVSIKHLRVAVLVIRTQEMFRLTFWCSAVPVSPAVVFVREPARARHRAVDIFLRGAAVRGGGGGRGVVTVRVTFVTDRPPGAVCEIVIVTPVVHQVEHLGVAVLVIGTEVVLRLQTRLAVPVSPAVVGVWVVTLPYSITVNSLLWRGAVWLGGCGGGGRRAVNIPVRTRAVSAVHVPRVHTEPVENVILEVVRAGLVCDAATLALVELVAQLGVGLLDKVIRPTDGAVREGVVTLGLDLPASRQDQSDWELGELPVTHLRHRQRDNPDTTNCQVNIPPVWIY